MNLINRYKSFFSIALIAAFAFFIKLKDIGNSLGSENILSTHDAFGYARIAKELQNSSYNPINYLANVPDYLAASLPPPLISLIPLWLSSIFETDIDIFFLILPPLFSILFIVPFYFWTSKFSSIYVFIGGAFLGLFNLIYFSRTTLGYFDTDCLILFFVFAILYLITCAAENKENRTISYIYVTLSGILYHIFMWWYDLAVFGLIFSFSLLIGLLVSRHSVKEAILKTLLFFVIANPLAPLNAPVFDYIAYLLGAEQGLKFLPVDVFSSIVELQPVDASRFVMFTTDNYIAALLSFIGLALLIVKHFRYMAISVPILLIGLSSFETGNRYIMYIATFMGMGIGYIIYLLQGFIKQRYSLNNRLLASASILIVVFISFPPQRLYFDSKPVFADSLYYEIKKLRDVTEQDAYIWTWWDYGYPIEYIASRATYLNNGSVAPEKLYGVAHSSITPEEDRAYKMISYITNKQIKDYRHSNHTINNMLEDVANYKASPNKTVYYVVFKNMLLTNYMHLTGFAGSKEKFPDPLVSIHLKCDDPGQETCDCGLFSLNMATEDVKFINEKVDALYRKVILVNRTKDMVKVLRDRKDAKTKNIIIVMFSDKTKPFYIIANELFEKTIMSRMFIFKEKFRHFDLIYDGFPNLVVYKVKTNISH